MPALSQNLTFTVNNTSTVAVNYPNTGTTALTFLSDKVKGDGYFGNSDGLHTVAWRVNDFIGSITLEGSLTLDPQSTDWVTLTLTPTTTVYSVDTTGLARTAGVTTTNYVTATTVVKSYNFIGNFVWLRGKINNFTQGTVNFIKINR